MTSPARTLRRLALAAGAVALLLASMPAVARTEALASEPAEPSAQARSSERPGMRRLQQAAQRHRFDPRSLDAGPSPAWLDPSQPTRSAPPANDSFAAAELITWIPSATPGTTREATTEPGEPTPKCATVSVAGNTVRLSGATTWFRFTAKATGRLLVYTADDSMADPVVAVYRGSSLGDLTEVACSDDKTAPVRSPAFFQATKGVTYHVQVGAMLSQATDLLLVVSKAYEGAISGTVRDAAGLPLKGICVTATGDDDSDYINFYTSSFTGTDGTYRIPYLPEDTYRVHFSDCTSPYEYRQEWYRDAYTYADATPVTVGRSEVAGIDATLSIGASISGTVTDQAGEPLEGMCVTGYSDNYNDYAWTETDAAGHYKLGGLDGGSYVVLFGDCGFEDVYITEYYDDKRSSADADRVVVEPGGSISGVDASLERGASISGVVLDEQGTPQGSACISAVDRGGSYAGWGWTDEDGAFRVGALPGGEYRIMAGSCGDNPFVAQWYDEQPDQASADPIAVAAQEDLVGIEMIVRPGGTIQGTVSIPAGTGYEDACIDAYDATGDWAGDAYSGGDGSYSMKGLAPGAYRIQFYDCGDGGYASAWNGGATDFGSAPLIVVTEGQTVDGVHGRLTVGGSISGSITGPGGATLDERCASAVDASGWWVGGDYWEQDSAYRIDGLPAGPVSVELSDCWSELAQEWYPDAPHRLAGQPVPVNAGSVTSGIDAELGPGGTIEGSVVDTRGTPAVELCADAVDESGDYASWGGTDAQGALLMQAMPAGEYRLLFWDCDLDIYAERWYEDAESYADATPVPVRVGEATRIDAVIGLRADAPKSLEVRFAGGGRVVSSPAGIDCTATCTVDFAPGTSVTLTADAAPGFVFAGWDGAGCSSTCTIRMYDDRAVRPLFVEA